MATSIHPTALVHECAQLGADVEIGPHAIIEDKTIIGDRTRIQAAAQIKAYTHLGADNVIHSFACLGGEPQDLKFSGEESLLRIGDGNTVREFVTMNRGTALERGETVIGSGGLYMAYVHIAHDCRLGDGVIMSNGATLAGHVVIGDHVIVGGLSAVHQFVRIGEYAFIGGMTGVVQDVPPYMLAAGPRAKVHGPNLVGLRRLNFPPEKTQALKNAYRLLWRSELGRKEALARIAETCGEHSEVRSFLAFVEQSERGVTAAE